MKRPFYLTKDQVKQMVDWAFEHRKKTAIRDKLIIELLFKCGLRSNELRNLRIEDIRNNNSIDIEKPKGGDKKKGLFSLMMISNLGSAPTFDKKVERRVISSSQTLRSRFLIDPSGVSSRISGKKLLNSIFILIPSDTLSPSNFLTVPIILQS